MKDIRTNITVEMVNDLSIQYGFDVEEELTRLFTAELEKEKRKELPQLNFYIRKTELETQLDKIRTEIGLE
jgi:hypothetical protein